MLSSILGRQSFSRYDGTTEEDEQLISIIGRPKALDCTWWSATSRAAGLLQHAAERLRLRRPLSGRTKPLRTKFQVPGQNSHHNGLVL